ncbi:MAG: peptidoglycan-binding domain-containing protein, partial [Desulfobacteraceae bacterium]
TAQENYTINSNTPVRFLTMEEVPDDFDINKQQAIKGADDSISALPSVESNSPQRLPVRNIENLRRSDFFPIFLQGFSSGESLGVDGIFRGRTKAAVKRFQRGQRLVVSSTRMAGIKQIRGIKRSRSITNILTIMLFWFYWAALPGFPG